MCGCRIGVSGAQRRFIVAPVTEKAVVSQALSPTLTSFCPSHSSSWPHQYMMSKQFCWCRIMGLARGWKKLYCALVPFSREVGADSTELQLLFIDTQSFTLVDRIWVTGSQSEPFMCRDRLQVEMVSTRCTSCILLGNFSNALACTAAR